MYGDQFGEFVCGYWGLKGEYSACPKDKWIRNICFSYSVSPLIYKALLHVGRGKKSSIQSSRTSRFSCWESKDKQEVVPGACFSKVLVTFWVQKSVLCLHPRSKSQ